MNAITIFRKGDTLATELSDHLKSWGLCRFTDESRYYQWQKDRLTNEEIAELNRLSLARGGGRNPEADMRFYDLAARPGILPVLYSQRYEYYLEIGCAITGRIHPADRVLDFGCGVGILTTFYACCFPEIKFVGVDRSSSSIARAREEAIKRGLLNVHFEHRHLPLESISESFDLIISSQALFQAEKDPGLPSRSWRSFDRAHDLIFQEKLEVQTGLKARLEPLLKILSLGGRLLVCEKAWHLGRRVLLQRALANRKYRLIHEPVYFQYRAIDEEVQEGPLFEFSRAPGKKVWPWQEDVTMLPGESLYKSQGQDAEEFISSLTEAQESQTLSIGGNPRVAGTVALARWRGCLAYGFLKTQDGFRGAIIGNLQDEKIIHQYFCGAERWTEEEKSQVITRLWPKSEDQGPDSALPGYESHTAVAQNIWIALPDREVQDEATFREDDGRELHIEWGTCGPLVYLYWANTYDQRQLVLMTLPKAKTLRDYYQESLGEMKRKES